MGQLTKFKNIKGRKLKTLPRNVFWFNNLFYGIIM